MTERRMACYKLGGSVLDGHAGFMQAAEYLAGQYSDGLSPVAVVSAPKGVSELLIDAAEGRMRAPELRSMLDARYRPMIAELVDGSGLRRAREEMEKELARIEAEMDGRGRDCFLALGENHSGILLSYALRSLSHDSHYTDGYYAGVSLNRRGSVDEAGSTRRLRELLSPQSCGEGIISVIGGYVARTPDGKYRLMGRNTTDVTAALVSCAAGAAKCEIIKEVPGVFRVEPEFCETGIIPNLSYGEAEQISLRGARVVHPHAVNIARRNRLPVRVKSLGSDECTLISEESGTDAGHPVAAISAGRFYVVSVSDDMMNTPEGRGYLGEVAAFFPERGIDIMDAALPANTISVAIPEKHGGPELDSALDAWLEERGYNPGVKGRRLGGISLTGEAMRGVPGMLSRISGMLGSEGISIAMGTQSDEMAESPVINLYVVPEMLGGAIKALCGKLFE